MKTKPPANDRLQLRAGDLLVRDGRLMQVVLGDAGPDLVDVTDELVGVAELVRHLKLSGLMIVTRWVRAGCPHVVIGKRRFFSLPAVLHWLSEKGYRPGEVGKGKGMAAARKRGENDGWHKGTMKPLAGQGPAAGKEKARGR